MWENCWSCNRKHDIFHHKLPFFSRLWILHSTIVGLLKTFKKYKHFNFTKNLPKILTNTDFCKDWVLSCKCRPSLKDTMYKNSSEITPFEILALLPHNIRLGDETIQASSKCTNKLSRLIELAPLISITWEKGLFFARILSKRFRGRGWQIKSLFPTLKLKSQFYYKWTKTE